MPGKEYKVTHENEVKRDPEKSSYDQDLIRKIVQEAHFVNVAFVDEDGHPQCIPMIHAVTEESGHLYIYLHGYRRARLVRLLPPETRVCITATLLDGLALALSAFSSSINHRSAILHGEVVAFDGEDDDTEEKQKVYDAKYEAGRQIVEKVMPGRWDHARQPSKAEMATTGFLKIRVLSGSAKCRAGQPGEERRDMLDEELIQSTWAGVVPIRAAYGTPEPSDFNVALLPEYIAEYIAKAASLSG